MSILLEIRDLTVRYRGAPAPAVEGLSFSLEEGEILSLHGPSGSGKSTVVWALMGMLEAYHASASGEITFLGEKTAPRRLRRQARSTSHGSRSGHDPPADSTDPEEPG